MIRVQTYFITLLVGFMFICAEPQALAPYSNLTITLPYNTYDLGRLNSTDIIKVNITWFPLSL